MRFFFGFALCFLLNFPSRLTADDDDKQAKKIITNFVKAHNNQSIIFLDKATQIVSGLKMFKLTPITYRPELLSYGTAISIEPLLSLQNQYFNALAQQNSTRAKVIFSQNNVNRLTYLHKEQIISTRALQDQQAILEIDKAAQLSSHYLSQQILNNAKLVWGQTLTDWLINAHPQFTALLQQRTTLLKITFPQKISIANSALKTIFVASTGHREHAVAAELISAVPQADSFSQGQQYFYQLSSQQIKVGLRVSAWIPTTHYRQTGVNIPESALCWHLGQALVFVKVAQEQFSHRILSAYRKTADGYFVSSGLKAGEEIVSSGAQMLLSQEFKGQIPNEDDD